MPIRDFGNIISSTTVICPTTSNMSPNNNMNMITDFTDDLLKKNCDNYDKVRGHFLALSAHCPCLQVSVMRTMPQKSREKVTE